MAWSAVANPTAGTTVSTTAFGNLVAGNFAVLGSAWTTYVPTFTGITLAGGGSVTGKYVQVGKTVDFQILFTFGAGSAVTGSISIALPATSLNTNWTTTDCNIFDTSANAWYPCAAIATTTTVVTTRVWPSVAGNPLSVTSSTVPMTWATGDTLTINGRYEAA